MHYQRIVPFFQLTTSASLIVALSVALTPHLEVYRPKDFDDYRRAWRIDCCMLQVGRRVPQPRRDKMHGFISLPRTLTK